MIKFNDIIKKSYFINLDKSTERRRIFESQIEKLGIINCERYVAKDIHKFFSDHLPDLYNNSEPHERAAFGLSFSNFEIYDKILNDDTISNDDYICIFEDDCVFLSNFESGFNRALEQIPDGFDILNLGGLIQPKEMDKNIAISKNLIKIETEGLFMAQAVIYKKSVLFDLIEVLRSLSDIIYNNKKLTYDVIIDHLLSNHYKDFNSYVCYPPLTYQLTDNSLIQKDETKFLDLKLRNKKKIKSSEILDTMYINLKEECDINKFTGEIDD